MLNKPKRVYCTQHDPAGRTRAVDLLTSVKERVFPVGRLDADSMGLLILTNDGELAQTLTHPSFSVSKTYRAEVTGSPTAETIERLRGGVWLAGGRTSRATVRLIHRQRDKAILEITLKEGRNRQVRRMLSKAGHKVRRLTRIQIGKLSSARLPLLPFLKCLLLMWALGLLSPACTSSGVARDGEFASVWRDYSSLPQHRAIALAGDLRRSRWVIGMAGGLPSSELAIEAALRSCQKQRGRRRMQDPCKIYAVGAE